jgi:hypothetical protein
MTHVDWLPLVSMVGAIMMIQDDDWESSQRRQKHVMMIIIWVSDGASAHLRPFSPAYRAVSVVYIRLCLSGGIDDERAGSMVS